MRIRNNLFGFEGITFFSGKDRLKKAVLVLVISLSIILQLIAVMKSPISGRYMTYNVISSIAIISISIYCIVNKIHLLKLKEVNENLLEVNDKVRCFRHDFNNIMQAIDGYIVLEDMDSLQTYFNSLVKECNYVNVIDLLNNKIKENPAILSVLLSKYKLAEEYDIKMNIDILVDLSRIKKKSYMISRILGILLDNAIEACMETDDRIINVQCIKDNIKNRMLIKIENSYMNKQIDIDKIFEKEYTTKPGNSGLGLWKIKDILRFDTNLDLFTTKDENLFKQQLEIYE